MILTSVKTLTTCIGALLVGGVVIVVTICGFLYLVEVVL